VRPNGDKKVVFDVAGTTNHQAAVDQAARILSLNHDATTYPEVGQRDPRIGTLMEALPGLRPLCFLSPYECAAWAVISQRISMKQGAAIQCRLVEEYGNMVEVAGEAASCFPHPETLLQIAAFPGLASVKIDRLHGVARAALDGILDVRKLLELGPVDAPLSVRSIPGIGTFWSSGIYLRACGVTDIFADELISIAALGALHGLGDRPSRPQIEERTNQYRPWRMWVCYLLRVAAGSAGLIEGIAGREVAIRQAR